MQLNISKSLRNTILEEIFQLNQLNAEFLALAHKLKPHDTHNIEVATLRLEAMRADIRDKIRNFSSNVDLLYQIIDKKLSILIGEVKRLPSQEQCLVNSINETQAKINDLTKRLDVEKTRNASLSTQNERLKDKNIELLEEIQALNRKLDQSNTNHSSSNSNLTSDHFLEHQISIQKQLSPLQGRHHSENYAIKMDHESFGSYKKTPNNKKFKSEENSFSSLLIKQQNSFQPSNGSNNESNILRFGCMPTKPKTSEFLGVSDQVEKSQASDAHEQGQGHRLNFLLSNLKSKEQKICKTHSTLEYGLEKKAPCGQNTSISAQQMVKKYQI